MLTESTSLRLDIATKKKAYTIFKEVGLKPAQAVNLFFKQVSLNKGLPFEIKIPNKETVKAMVELDKKSTKKFNNSKEFYQDLGI